MPLPRRGPQEITETMQSVITEKNRTHPSWGYITSALTGSVMTTEAGEVTPEAYSYVVAPAEAPRNTRRHRKKVLSNIQPRESLKVYTKNRKILTTPDDDLIEHETFPSMTIKHFNKYLRRFISDIFR